MKALPLVTIQPDLPDVVSDVLSGAVGAEQCWISCYKHGLPSIHAKALLTANDDDSAVRYESLDERVHVAAAGQRSLTVSCAALGLPAQLVSFPSSSTSVTSTGIDVLAVAPDRSSIAVASRSAIRILDGHTLAPKLSLQGHIGDVRSMRFFPSSEVLLTGASDARVRVFSVKDGSNPRTLVGHTRAVTSLAILGRGKLVVSGSSDGTVRVWRLSDGECVLSRELSDEVTTLDVLDAPQDALADSADGCSVVAGLSSGRCVVVDLSAESLQPLRTLAGTQAPPVTSLAVAPKTRSVALGSRDGAVSVYDITRGEGTEPAATLRLQLRRSETTIRSLQWIEGHLLVATSDGAAYMLALRPHGDDVDARVTEDFAGNEMYACVAHGVDGHALVGSKDGCVRVYTIDR